MDMAESHVVSALANKRAEIGRDCRLNRPSTAADRPMSRRSGLSGCDHLFAPAMAPETIPGEEGGGSANLISGSNQSFVAPLSRAILA